MFAGTSSKPSPAFPSRTAAFLALAVAATLAIPAEAEERWVPLRPSGGIVRDVTKAASDRNRLYVLTEESGLGLFRSRDGGRSWQSIRQGLDGSGIFNISVSPRDPDFVVVATGSSQIWRSRDAGSTWTPAARPPRTEDGIVQTAQLLFVPGAAGRIYAGTGRGIFRSLDGGSTWDSWALHNVSVTTFVRDPAVPASWFASGYEVEGPERGVFRSDDGGTSWSLAASDGGPGEYAPERLFFHSGALYSQWNGLLYRTTDGAATWSLAARPPTFFAYDYALSPSGSIFSATDRGVYSSTDGVNWSPPEVTSIDQALPRDAVSRLALLPAAPGAPGGSSETVIATGRRGIWRSTDGGCTWEPSSRGIAIRNVGSLVVIPNPQGTVLASFDDGLLRIDRAGDSWRRLPRPAGYQAPILAADPHHPGRVYALSDDFWVSEDQGNSWTRLSELPHSGVTVFKVDPGQPDVLWAGITLGGGSSENGFAHRSLDGGRTWTQFQSFQYLLDIVFDPDHPKILYRLTYEGLDRSIDGGLTWSPQPDLRSQLLGASPNSLLFEPRSRALYVSTDQRGVFRSTDSGKTFRRVAAGLPLLPRGLNPFVSTLILDAAGDLYAALWGAGVYRLRPGQGWTEVNAGLPLDKFWGPLVADPDRPGLIYAPTFGASVLRLEDR